MSLPINAKKLIESNLIESERIELKENFNPRAILHTMCAFANDLNNWGGGYILIGVDDDKNIIGLEEKQIDSIMKKIIELANRIQYPYFPIVEPIKYNDKHIIILYCPGGPARPYKAPKELGVRSEYKYYIRHSSSTVIANHHEEQELIFMSNKIPFDDQINHKAEITDLNLQLIKAFLKEIGSDLNPNSLSFRDLCKSLNIVEGPDEYLKPKNIGLLFFSLEPEKFIQTPWIETTYFYDDIGDKFDENKFTGSIFNQVRQALLYLKNSIITEKVIKIPNQAEAKRIFNYPYAALEEALINAVYHKNYDIDAPIEVRIETDRIDIISYPGPLPPLNKDNINDKIVISKKYRNRRIGDFLKELHLTEGKNTGLKKIRRALNKNGSPKPKFITDKDRIQFITRLKIHHDFKKTQEGVQAELIETDLKILNGQLSGQLRDKQLPKQVIIDWLGKSWEKVGKRLGINQLKIIVLISTNKEITIEELSTTLGISTTAIENNIKKLKDGGVLERVGGRKEGFWELLK